MINTVLIWFFMISGLFFFMTSTIGLLRLPDVYSRIHATSKSDTLGAGLSLLGLAVYSGFESETIKIFITLLLLWIANPTASHAIARTAYKNGVPLYKRSFEINLHDGGGNGD